MLLTPLERAQEMMKLLHKEPQTADQLAAALNIPSATIRKTLTIDYRQCFDRDPDNRRLITLTGRWPDEIEFDIEARLRVAQATPTQAQTQAPPTQAQAPEQLKAEHLKQAVFTPETEVISSTTFNYLRTDFLGGLTAKNREKYWRVYNTLKYFMLLMELVKSRDPYSLLMERVDNPSDLKIDQQSMIQRIITSKEKTK